MAEAHVLPPTQPPSLVELNDADERIEAMREWFLANFDDPANSLPYESKEGGYQWIWGGPYNASDEINDFFQEADEDERNAAIEYVEDVGGVQEWTVASRRIVSIDPEEGEDEREDVPDFDPNTDGRATRRRPPTTDRRAFTIVETILYPQRDYRWSVHATFIPGDTNEPLGGEFGSGDGEGFGKGDFGAGSYGGTRRELGSLRQAVMALIDLEIEGVQVGREEELEDARDWIDQLTLDSDLFVDDSIIVHASPADWFPLAKLFADTGSASAIVLTADSIGHGAGLLIAYGGARIVLRLFHNANYLQDAFAERLGNRIRRGDFDKGKGGESKKKRKK